MLSAEMSQVHKRPFEPYPDPVLGTVFPGSFLEPLLVRLSQGHSWNRYPFLEPFCGHLSPKVDKICKTDF